MDNGLVLASAKILTLEKSGLNPFCNGQWSRTLLQRTHQLGIECLNPFCNGQWSRTLQQLKLYNYD